MSASFADVLSSPAEVSQTDRLEELTRRGRLIYDNKLKAKLEPDFDGRFIAIEPDTEAYAVADSSGNAMRAMHKTHPGKPVLLMKIGPGPETELAIRILGAQALARARQK